MDFLFKIDLPFSKTSHRYIFKPLLSSKNMKKILIITIITILIALAFFAGFYLNKGLTAQVVNVPENNYTFTKAVCEDNKCVDVRISCKGDSLTNIELISDVQEFSPNWVDPRTEEEKNKLCD